MLICAPLHENNNGLSRLNLFFNLNFWINSNFIHIIGELSGCYFKGWKYHLDHYCFNPLLCVYVSDLSRYVFLSLSYHVMCFWIWLTALCISESDLSRYVFLSLTNHVIFWGVWLSTLCISESDLSRCVLLGRTYHVMCFWGRLITLCVAYSDLSRYAIHILRRYTCHDLLTFKGIQLLLFVFVCLTKTNISNCLLKI